MTMRQGLLLLSIYLFVGSSYAQPGPLVVAVPQAGYPPYIIVNEHGVSGILVEVLRLATAKKLEFHFAPEKRSKLMLDVHKVDARMESPSWVGNANDYLWSEPVVPINDVFVFSKKIPNHFESNQDLKGAQLVTHLGYSYPSLRALFDQAVVQRIDASTEHAMLAALLRNPLGQARAAVMDKLVAQWLIKRNIKFQGQLMFSRRITATAALHIQFANTKHMKELVPKLNAKIRSLKADGTVAKIIHDTLHP